jgi:hypothetical protein
MIEHSGGSGVWSEESGMPEFLVRMHTTVRDFYQVAANSISEARSLGEAPDGGLKPVYSDRVDPTVIDVADWDDGNIPDSEVS